MINLKEKRDSQGMTQAQVCDRANIALRTYQYYERGERTPPVHITKRLAKILGFEWEKFYAPDDKDTA